MLERRFKWEEFQFNQVWQLSTKPKGDIRQLYEGTFFPGNGKTHTKTWIETMFVKEQGGYSGWRRMMRENE